MAGIIRMKDVLEGKTLDEQIAWFKNHLAYQVGRNRRLGKIEAYTDMGLSPLQIAEKLDLPESHVRRCIHDLELEKKRIAESKESE